MLMLIMIAKGFARLWEFLTQKWVMITGGVMLVLALSYSAGWYHRGKSDKAEQVDQVNAQIKAIMDKNAKDREMDLKANEIYQQHLQVYQEQNRKLQKRLNDAKKMAIGTDCAAPVDGVRALNEFNDSTK
ncbi:MAG: hypothetical protein IPP74_10125 [Alphaproteobacteria bacterium]|nr:hypothetical protein [Alphaproteobacteria bacterium]